MELLKQSVEKNGKRYTDVSISYTNKENNKTYVVRVRPVFWHDMRLLTAIAKEVKQ